jgi:hypothetical protein
MAFFGLFKSKEEKSLDSHLSSILSVIFPMGEEDISRDCKRIDILTNGKIPDPELKGFVTGCKTLVAINTSYDDDGFVRSNVARSKNRINETEARDVYVYLAGESIYRARITNMSKEKGNELPAEFSSHLDQLGRTWAAGTTQDRISGGTGEFGLADSNPIPTVCVNGSNVYLSRLRFNSKGVVNKRIGSTISAVTKGNVDIYQLSQYGADLAKIYICPYHRKDSKIAPKGFTLQLQD